jgi:hypothetical protein
MRILLGNLVLVFAAISVVGCATVPLGADVISKIPTNDTVLTFSTAIAGGAEQLSGKGVRFKLAAGDRVFAFPQYLSYYKIFELPSAMKRAGHIRITGECTCLGFDKRTPIPVAYVLTSQGRVVAPESVKYSVRSGVLVDLDMDVAGGDASYILVGADNSAADKVVGHIYIAMYGSTVDDLSVRSYPTGTFHLTYSTLK